MICEKSAIIVKELICQILECKPTDGLIIPEDPVHKLILVAALVSSAPLAINEKTYYKTFKDIGVWGYKNERGKPATISLADVVFCKLNPLYKPRDVNGDILIDGSSC